MQIRQNLPQFENTTALIVASGKQDAIFYIAQNGEIHIVESFKVEKPTYDDVEGHFESTTKTGMRGQTMKSGSPYEPSEKDEKAVASFLKELKEEFESVSRHHDIDELYVFAPPHLKNEVEERIPYSLHQAKQLMLEGNHYDTHPHELLEKIQKKQSRNPVKPMTEAARKILNKFKR